MILALDAATPGSDENERVQRRAECAAISAFHNPPAGIHLPGRTVEITHPEQVAFASDKTSAMFLTPDGHIHILDMREINGLELRPARRGNAA